MSASPSAADLVWVLIASALVMLMQGGFCLLETGFSRAKNSINVAIKNLIDFCISGLAFWAFGFALMFGQSWHGLVGTTDFFPGETATPWFLTLFLFQLMFCSTSTTIISGAAAERIRFSAYLVVALFVSAVIYPIFGHWAWGGTITGTPTGWLARMGFIDFAGSTCVHSVGGWVSLALILVLGPRIGRFAEQQAPMHGHSLVLSTMGTFLLWFGWFGFNGGSALGMTDKVPLILLNTNLAAAAGGLAALGVAWSIERLPNVGQTLNGVIAGLVAVTAGCHLVSPVSAVVIGLIAGALAAGGTYALEKLKIDDVVGAFPVHGLCGMLGTLAVAIFAPEDSFGIAGGRGQQFLVQLLGIGVCAGWSFGLSYLVFWLVNRFWPLRVSVAHEELGLNVSEHGAVSEIQVLLGSMHEQRLCGNFSQGVRVEPHTEVGQIAAEYNRVLERVNAEIAAREIAIEQARQAEEKYRSIFENAVEGIFQTTPAGTYLSANPKLAQIYGYDTPQELMQSLCDIRKQLYVLDERREEFRKLIEERGIVTEFESQVYRRDGSVIWISENARAVRDAQGEIQYYEGTVEDITERKRNADLQAEKDAALAASAAKSAFLANMSHEIRTPLNGVIGMLELLCATTLDERQARYARIARSSAGTLLGLINDVLDFSKIEAGKLELEIVNYDLPLLLEDIAEMFSHRAAQKKLELICQIQPGVPPVVRGDPERLRQVLINLCNNAIKFTESGEIRLKATVLEQGADRTMVRLAVEDTGIGIPPDRRNRLFNAFSQVDASTTRKYGGTGLGLAICKQLVELMGGRIDVESVDGRGSTFFVDMPMEVISSQTPVSSLPPADIRGLRVLAVDDTNTNLEILRDQLRLWGLQVTTLAEPRAAVAELQSALEASQPYQLVILDHQMPEMDGMELAARIKAVPKLKRTPLLMLTSADMQIDRGAAREKGLEGVMSKPIRQSRLLDEVVQLLKPTGKLDPASLAPAVAAIPSHGKNKKILVADDNEINQQVTGEILRSAGYSCDIVGNGKEALAALARGGYDLVLMDCQMPEMDGFAATGEIRRLESTASLPHCSRGKIPVIALTANAVRGDRENCLEAGMDDYATKPIDPRALLSTIAKWINTPGSGGAIAAPIAGNEQRGTSNNESSSAQPVGPVLANVPQPAACAPTLDFSQLLERCGGDARFAHKMLTKFHQRLPADRTALTAAVQAGNFEQARKLAHTLKGAAGNLAAVAVQTQAAALESALATADLAVAPESLAELESRIEECLLELAQILQVDNTEGRQVLENSPS